MTDYKAEARRAARNTLLAGVALGIVLGIPIGIAIVEYTTDRVTVIVPDCSGIKT